MSLRRRRVATDWLYVERALSDTPLAAAHTRYLDRAPARPPRAIPWADFARDEVPKEARLLAADQARKLAEGEYAAVALFGQIAAGLAMTRAPFDLVSACAAIGGDEIRHADYCTQMAEHCLGESIELRVPRHEVVRECRDALELAQLDYLLLKYSAVGESLAAALLQECAEGAKVPIARAMYRNLVRDEIHHARLGWYYFAWRAPQWTLPERQQLADRIAEFVVDLEQEFFWGRDASSTHHDAAVAMGVLDTERQRRAIAQVMEQELVPGLDALGLGASHAWAARRRGNPGARRRVAAWVATPRTIDPARAVERGARWLAARVDAEGGLESTLDLRGEHAGHGAMQHGRAAVALQALRACGGHEEAAERLAQRLTRELEEARDGRAPAGWPLSPWMAAGTYALACHAGLPFVAALEAAVADLAPPSPHDLEAIWHVGQIASVLGERLPAWVRGLCDAELASERWAPWSTRAAFVRGDRAGFTAGCRRLVRGLTHELMELPTAVVAASLEVLALEREPSAETARAIEHASAQLCVRQLASGAFPLTGDDTLLRVDVTAHALLALEPAARG